MGPALHRTGSPVCWRLHTAAVPYLAAMMLFVFVAHAVRSQEIPNHIRHGLNFHSFLDDVLMVGHPESGWNELFSGLSIGVFGLDLHVTFNSTFPHGGNDGAIWTGRGATASAKGGFVLTTDFLRFSFIPLLYWSQNLEFDHPPGAPLHSEYSFPWRRLDIVQRFGDSSYVVFDWGYSEVRVVVRNLTLGLSNDSIWLGPAIVNPLMLSPNAPGFMHIDIGTHGILQTPIGALEGRLFWGQLEESEYFDDDPDNDTNVLSAMTLSYSPAWLPEFTFGLHRVFTAPWTTFDWELDKFFQLWESFFKFDLITEDNPEGLDDSNQIASVTVEYRSRGEDFRVFFEWGRNDHELSLSNFLLTPQHTQAFTIGFAKTFFFDSLPMNLALKGEVSSTDKFNTQLFPSRRHSSWYTHGRVRQGYTHRGQLLGALVGSGGNFQYASATFDFIDVDIGAYLYRHNRNNDFYLDLFAETHDMSFIDVDMTFGLDTSWRVAESVEFSVDFAFTRNFNRDFRFDYELDEEGEVSASGLDNDPENVSISIGIVHRTN